jgi:galactose mutarotase-like enzyme
VSAALDEPERRNTIRGLVRWLPLRLVRNNVGSVMSSGILPPQPAYTPHLEWEVEYRVDAGCLTVATRATDRTDVAAPFGIGFHPYLSAGRPNWGSRCATEGTGAVEGPSRRRESESSEESRGGMVRCGVARGGRA